MKTTLMTAALAAVALAALAPTATAIGSVGDLVGSGSPHVCSLSSNGLYYCYGVDGSCVIYWSDDDDNGDAHDANATRYDTACYAAILIRR